MPPQARAFPVLLPPLPPVPPAAPVHRPRPRWAVATAGGLVALAAVAAAAWMNQPQDLPDDRPPPVAADPARAVPAPASPPVEPPSPAASPAMLPPSPAIPDAPAPAPALAPDSRKLIVRPGQTLFSLLDEAGVEEADAQEAVAALAEIGDPDRLRAGQEIQLTTRRNDGAIELRELVLPSDPLRRLTATREEDGTFTARAAVDPVTRKPTLVQLRIRTSLHDAATAAGMPATVLAGVIRAFARDVDFQRDLQPGDTLELLYERDLAKDGRPVRSGAALYAKLQLKDRKLALIRHTTGDGRVGYVAPDGRAMRAALLRTPLEAARITSGFGMRHHPILGYSRRHQGVDFAAAKGTPVFAAGDGTVETAATNGGYGNYIRLRHDSTWGTAYGHLSRFARDLKPGARVRQGQVIGYVGASGLATGPHLHFEVIKDSRPVDPKTAASVRPATDAREQDALRKRVRDLETQMAALRRADKG